MTLLASPRVRDPARRDKILAAAAELFAGRGYHAVSLAEIGAASGIVTRARPGMPEGEARARVHAAIGAIQSVASHNSELPRADLVALLSSIARACLISG